MNAEQVRAWLTARLDEDEQRADQIHREDCSSLPPPAGCYGPFPCDCRVPERLRREVEAKRRILDDVDWYETNTSQFMDWLVKLLALPYSDRDDFPAELRLP